MSTSTPNPSGSAVLESAMIQQMKAMNSIVESAPNVNPTMKMLIQQQNTLMLALVESQKAANGATDT